MAGTPMKTRARRSSMRSSTAVASNRRRAATGTPARANPSPAEKPMMWAMGRAITAVGAGQHVQGPQPGRADQCPVAELHALRVARRPRRVEEGGQVVGAGDGGRGRQRAPARPVELGRVADDERGAGVVHDVVDLGSGASGR